jgi:sulfoxide reductase heme-binding subunit YedZ
MTWWYLARAAGVVMLVCFTFAVCLGALASGRVDPLDPNARERRLLTQYLHRAAAVTGMLLIVVHATAIVVDGKSGVALSGVLIPLTAGYRPVAVALGTLSAYLFVFVALLGAGRGRIATSARGARLWRVLHGASYLAWAACILHGFLAGTDAGTVWMDVIDVACLGAFSVCVAIRVRSQAMARRRPLAAGRRELARVAQLNGSH